MSSTKFRKNSKYLKDKKENGLIFKKNPFEVEKMRQKLALLGDLIRLKGMYSVKYPEIKNLNTGRFWNTKLKNRQELKIQDGMTKDRARIVARLIPGETKKLLDIGIGHGWIEEIISKKDIKIYGIDISEETIKNLNRNFEGEYIVQSVYEMTFPKSYFDTILILEVLEHIPPSRVLIVLRDIKKLLKKNGTLIVSVPVNERLELMRENPNGHVRDYSKELIKAELEISGFKPLVMRTLYAFKSFYFAKKLLARLLINRWHENNVIIKAVSL